MSGPLVLGIESSCDETSVGIVRGAELLANLPARDLGDVMRVGSEMARSGKVYWCKELGISESDPVSGTEFGTRLEAATELLTAIDYALKGKTYVTPLLAAQIEQHRQNQSTAPARGLAALTRRQREVLQLLAEGHSTKEAAAILDISARTVEFHKYGMMETLGLKSTAELMHFAFKH